MPLLAAAILIPLALTVLAVLLGHGWVWIPVGVMVSLLAALIVLNLRSNAAMMNIAEGQPQRVRSLMGRERRRLSKVIGNAPLYDYMIGQGELSIRKLRTTVMKLPRNLTGKDVKHAGQAPRRADGPAADAEGRDPEDQAPVEGPVPPAAPPLTDAPGTAMGSVRWQDWQAPAIGGLVRTGRA